MSTTTNDVAIKLMYEDSTTRTYTMKEVEDENLNNVATKIKAINDNTNQQYNDFYNTFVSTSGSKVMRIAGGSIKTVTEEVIYSAD